MRIFLQWLLASGVMAVAMQWNGTAAAQVYGFGDSSSGGGEKYAALAIKFDGSCLFTSVTIESRSAAEQQVRTMERYQKMSEGENGGEPSQQPDLSATNTAAVPKPFTDEELGKKISASMNQRAGEGAEDKARTFNVEVKKDSVTITATHAFASIEEMLKESYAIWNQGGVYFDNVRFETDTNGLLRVTLSPRSGMDRYLKSTRAAWKLSGAKSELKIIFPGKVIASGFPAMQTNATWLVMDAKQDETFEAVVKLYAAPTVITAELGGLKLSQPLESKKLYRSSRQRVVASDDLPITDAGPGFLAEAQSVTTTTFHVFHGGENYFKQSGNNYGAQTGTVVNVKLFAPRGRTLQSVNEVRVFTAVDDKGRSVLRESKEDEDSSDYRSSGSADAGSLPFSLRLQLPPPDAQAIAEISGEAVAISVGSWKEITLPHPNENATNEVDLTALLPGAKMIITKLSTKNNQLNIQATLKGPRTVRGLELRVKIPGNDRFNSNFSERNFSTKNGESTRTVAISGYGVGEDVSSTATVVLIVRHPEDLRRERVKFNLRGLDLF